MRGTCFSQALGKLGVHVYRLAAGMAVSKCGGFRAVPPVSPPEIDMCLFSQESNVSFTVVLMSEGA